MPANIEVKARLESLERARSIALRLCQDAPEVIDQTDVFFPCRDGRLKLRIFETGVGELILYRRPDTPEARRSEYEIASTSDPQVLRQILERTVGSCGTVKKTRTLYLVGQTRIHLDQVENLGSFLELEVVLRPGQSDAEGQEIADRLLGEFGIQRDQIVSVAYIDLLNKLSA
ncbi:MAG TPA: class IV adenylate cyclase [Terriglobales bacterium]|jgi:predicted adenylyl cyclase CyaB